MDHVAAAAAALRWSLTSRIHSNGLLTPAQGMAMTHRHRGGTSIHLLLTTISSLSFCVTDLFHWFCYELCTSSGQCPSTTPQNLWTKHEEKHPIHTRTCRTSCLFIYLCDGMRVFATLHRGGISEIHSTIGNRKKQSLENPTSERARLWLTKRIYIEKLIYFYKWMFS